MHRGRYRLCDDALRIAPAALVQAADDYAQASGYPVQVQWTLLAGVNDDILTLQSLSEALHAHGVLPYYLHQLDRVQGAAHFSVPDARAIALHRELVSALPGYLVPKLVRETAGEPNKSPLY